MNRTLGAKFLFSVFVFLGFVSYLAGAQTINTTCTLYPGAAYCTSTVSDGGAAAAAQARRQQYETGQAIGSGSGMAIFRAHFPDWWRNYCSELPASPSITATHVAIRLQELANEAAAEFLAKRPGTVRSPEQAGAIDKYIANKVNGKGLHGL